jgi:hypothetical protein
MVKRECDSAMNSKTAGCGGLAVKKRKSLAANTRRQVERLAPDAAQIRDKARGC